MRGEAHATSLEEEEEEEGLSRCESPRAQELGRSIREEPSEGGEGGGEWRDALYVTPHLLGGVMTTPDTPQCTLLVCVEFSSAIV